MAGRKPKPLRIKELQGNPGGRKLNKKEPKFGGKVTIPNWMPPAAKIEFQRVVRELAALDLLKSTDQATLEAYCVAYARWKSAEAIVDEEGQTVKEPIMQKVPGSGRGEDAEYEVVGYKIKRHPATTIAKDERTSMARIAASFGFDPSSRSRIAMPDGDEEDDAMERFLSGDDEEDGPPSGVVH